MGTSIPESAAIRAAGVGQHAGSLAGSLKEAKDLALELSVCLAGVVAVADLVELEQDVPDRVRRVLAGAREDLASGAEYLDRLRHALDRAAGTETP